MPSPGITNITVNTLPEELLTHIFTSLKSISPSALPTCLLTCKRWAHSATGILYRDIVLHNSNLDLFLRSASENHGQHLSLVRTLTVSLEYPLEGPGNAWLKNAGAVGGTPKARRFNALVTRLPVAIHEMARLTSFSFTAQHDAYSGPTNFEMKRGKIAAMVRSLAGSCVNLEIVVCGPEKARTGGPDKYEDELCEGLGRVLPRLRHFHVQLGCLCLDLFGTSSGMLDGEEREEEGDLRSGSVVPPSFKAHYAPNLETMVIDCHCHSSINFTTSMTKACAKYTPSHNGLPKDRLPAKQALTPLLKTLVADGAFPSLKRLWLLDWHPTSGPREIIHRRDILTDSTWVFSRAHIGSGRLRTETPEGIKTLCGHGLLRDLAMARTWRTSTMGSRLPAAWFDSDGRGYTEVGLEGILEMERRKPLGLITGSFSFKPPFERDGVVD